MVADDKSMMNINESMININESMIEINESMIKIKVLVFEIKELIIEWLLNVYWITVWRMSECWMPKFRLSASIIVH